MDEDGNTNIYDDLPDFRYDETLDQLNASIAKLEAQNRVLQSRLVEIKEEKNVLYANCKVLKTNISSLLKTAKLEIKRKERTILELREQLNQVRPQRKQFGTKRRRETTVPLSPRKKPKFSPRKVRGESSRVRDTRSNSKSEIRESSNRTKRATLGERASRDEKTARRESPVRAERKRRDLVTEKENTPMKDALATKEPLVNGNCAGPPENVKDPSPEVAAPSLPALQCPTVFSSRMYKKLYGKECENTLPTLTANPSSSSDSIPPSVVGEPQTPPIACELHPSGSSNQLPSTSNCSRVTPEDIRFYLELDDSLDSHSSQSSDSIHLEVKPIATSYIKPRNVNAPSYVKPQNVNANATRYVKPQNVNVKISSKVPEADLGPDYQKHDGLPLKKLEVPIHQPPDPDLVPSIPRDEPGNRHDVPLHNFEVPIHQPLAVPPHSVPSVPPAEKLEQPHSVPSVLPAEMLEQHKCAEPPLEKFEVPIHQPIDPHSIPSIPLEDTKDSSSEVNLELVSRARTPAKSGLLAVGKTRQQVVAAIRPIQKLAVQEIPAMVGKSNQNRLVEQEPMASSENSPESKMIETHIAEKSSRHLRIPGLPGSAKGRTVRQVFAPISNQWNYSQPSVGNQNDRDKTRGSELSLVRTVSVTSELTVRVEDSKLDSLKKQSSAEALFGSPVKWADDSLDSPMTEGSANSRKLYSIFGSPLKNVDSNSSECRFSIPPAAYEDSCWTNQVPEKMTVSSSAEAAGEANVQKQSQMSQEHVTESATKPKGKSLEQSDTEKAITTDTEKANKEQTDTEKATTTCAFFHPPPSSVIKKHVSIFSPVKDSKHSITSNIPDERSRSNTGICFPFPRPKYEDSVLGQFDDTAQFVSALAKVDTQISPLSTPVKSGEGSNHTRSVIVEKSLTSFQQVFKKNAPEGTQKVHEPPTLGKDTVGIISAEPPNLSMLPKVSSNEGHAPWTPNQSVLSRHSSNERRDTFREEVPMPPKTVEPPKIKITPPKSESSVRLIHRPNFASSTMLSVKSWFPDAPVKMVTPRKTPRLVSSMNRSASPKGLDVSAGARVAINDAFIIEQEERVRRWELDLYDESTRSGSGSPLKSANGSLTRKRIDSPGKVSLSKRSPKKQISPCKSPRRAEVHRDVEVEPALHSTSAAVTASNSASNKETTVNQLVPCSANQTDPAAHSVNGISSQILTEPKSVPSTMQKVLTMIDAATKTKHTVPGFDSSSTEANKPETEAGPAVDVASGASKHHVEVEDTVVDEVKSRDCLNPEPPSGSALKQEIVPSEVATPVHTPCSNAVGKELCISNTTKEQVRLENPPDSALSCLIPPSSAPHLFNDKSSPHPVEAAQCLKENITEPSRTHVDSADPTVLPGSSSVANAKPSKILPNLSKRTTAVKASGNKKHQKTTQNLNSTPSLPIVPPISTESSHTKTPDQATSNGEPIEKKVANFSKYAALISQVKPSTPLNKAVAALMSSSVSSKSPASSRPRQIIKTNIVQSTKRSAFKRSSALKSDAKKGAGNVLMNSIRSTFFQGTPTSSVKAGAPGSQTQPPKLNIQPRLIRRKSEPNFSVNSTNTASVQSTTHKTSAKDGVAVSKTAVDTATRYDLALEATPESVVRDSETHSKKPAEKECSIPGQWKLREVDHQTKPVSLFQRFQESNEGLHHTLDSKSGGKSNDRTDESKVQNDSVSSAARSSVLNDAGETIRKEKPESLHMPKSDGVKVLNRGCAQFPPKSPVFPRSSRKTILLDFPLKMETPTKAKKRRLESIESPKPKETIGEASKSPESKEKCVEPKSGKKKRSATSGGRVSPENTSPKKSNKKQAEPSRADSPGKSPSRHRSRDHRPRDSSRDHRPRYRSRGNRSRDRSRGNKLRDGSRDHKSRKGSRDHSSRNRSRDHRSRDGSRSVSPRRSRRTDPGLSPKLRKKSHSTYQDSPEQSPCRKSSIKKSKIATKESAGGKSKATYHSSPELSPARKSSDSSCRKSKIATKGSAGGKCKTVSSESAGKQSKNSAAESVAKHSKAGISGSDYGSSKIVSSEVADENPKIVRSESSDDAPVVQVTASAPRRKSAGQITASFPPQKSAPVVGPNDANVSSAQNPNPDALRYSEFRSSVEITSSTPRIQPAATSSRSGPVLVIPGNRRLNFSSAPAARHTEIVISAGERPALFSRSS